MQTRKPTVDEVFDFRNDKYIDSESLLLSMDEKSQTKLRFELNEVKNDERDRILGCGRCFQIVKLRGGQAFNKRKLHFYHVLNNDDCPYSDPNKYDRDQILRIKFNGQQEGFDHLDIKSKLSNILINSENITNVEIEKRRILSIEDNSNEWKKPDIACNYNEYKIVFEIQLSTTFLDVIASRQSFYRKDKSFVIWVFKHFDKDIFTHKDTFYANNENAFVFSDESFDISINEKELILECHYHEYESCGLIIKPPELKKEYVRLSQITFNTDGYKAYYFDSDKSEKDAKLKVKKEEDIIRVAENKIKEEDALKCKQRNEKINESYNNIIGYIKAIKKKEKSLIEINLFIESLDIQINKEISNRLLYNKITDASGNEMEYSIVEYFIENRVNNIEVLLFLFDNKLNDQFKIGMLKIFERKFNLKLFTAYKFDLKNNYRVEKTIKLVFSLITGSNLYWRINRKAVFHKCFEEYNQEFVHLVFKAIEKYKLEEYLKDIRDNKYYFYSSEYKSNKFILNHKFDNIFKNFFPELF